ncbi:hypothetical protein VM1G_07552 [Cytospora mali]|uniref:PD-(D/E)XK nuclease-like domain-containing protein n=1 Tax=Cytospora mali TaxID=578113 RepID=A0A194W6S3_CYTMA|nr:hypothetical protein VM1G_07552 [Valsa mali]
MTKANKATMMAISLEQFARPDQSSSMLLGHDLKTLRVPVTWTTMKTSKTVLKALFAGADGTDTSTSAEYDDYGLRRLVQDLASIATRHTAFVPEQLRDVLADDDDFECGDSAFGPNIYNQDYWGGGRKTTTPPPPLSGQRQGQGHGEEDIDDNNNTMILQELNQLRDIINNTVRCQDLGRSEAAWNDKVHSRMLDLGTKLVEESVQAENITRAKIAGPFIPDGPASILSSSGAASAFCGVVDGTGVGGSSFSSSAIPAKLVDYALALQFSDPENSLSRRLVQFVATQSRKASSAIASSSRATRPSQQPPLLQPSGSGDPIISSSSAGDGTGAASLPTFHMFNQTPYRPLVYAPAGVFIETKVEGGSLDEGRLQLGLWVSAWFKRVSMFGGLVSDAPQAGGQVGGQGSSLPLPIIPLALVKSDAWEVFFARQSSTLLSYSSSSTSFARARARAQAQAREDEPRIDIIGPLKIGGTGDLASAYQLLLALRRLSFWVQDRSGFCGWVEQVVGM